MIARIWSGESPVWRLLLPLSWLYGLVSGLIRLSYRLGLKKAWRAPVPVAVVGNLTAGGNGKTPVVIWLVEQLQQRGIPVLLICEPQAYSLFPLSRWQLCAPLDSVSAYDSYSSVNSLINLLANAFLHEILDKGRPRIHDIATLYQQLDELEQR